jgi:hypothetical protein
MILSYASDPQTIIFVFINLFYIKITINYITLFLAEEMSWSGSVIGCYTGHSVIISASSRGGRVSRHRLETTNTVAPLFLQGMNFL